MPLPLETQIERSIEANQTKIRKAKRDSPEKASLAFGQALSRLRLQMRLTQAEVAKNAGVSQQKVCYWENGRCAPHIRELPTVAKGYNATMNKILVSFIDIFARNN